MIKGADALLYSRRVDDEFKEACCLAAPARVRLQRAQPALSAEILILWDFSSVVCCHRFARSLLRADLYLMSELAVDVAFLQNVVDIGVKAAPSADVTRLRRARRHREVLGRRQTTRGRAPPPAPAAPPGR
ncbi:hypothetical protein EVAR_23557_1 [Eumeta japonica]|uniref:Uncharacterized protein n=1 Tax=Eumeta variegata TaxID=151549 RepID=A0A4C1X089_EUMVA|nr:hypothetical protein EVAR_23557_1 [Eumeta japonica]